MPTPRTGSPSPDGRPPPGSRRPAAALRRGRGPPPDAVAASPDSDPVGTCRPCHHPRRHAHYRHAIGPETDQRIDTSWSIESWGRSPSTTAVTVALLRV